MKGIERQRLSVGDLAPDFDLPTLISGIKKRYRLREALAARAVVLAFYPHSWDPITARQLVEYQEAQAQFRQHGAEVVGISVDSIMNTTAWERELGPLDFPLCSDFWPHGEVSRAYCVLRESGAEMGASERAIIAVGRAGKILFRETYAASEPVPLAETLNAVREI